MYFPDSKSTKFQKISGIVLIFFVFFVFYLNVSESYSYRRYVGDQHFKGDELRYFRMAQSLATDGNLELSNIEGYKKSEAVKTDNSHSPLSDQFLHLCFIGKSGGIYTIHMPGLSVLLLPGYLLDSYFYPSLPAKAPKNLPYLPNKLYFTRLFLLLVSILVLLLLLRLLANLLNSIYLGIFLLLIFVLGSPFNAYVFEIFPELVASFFCLLALNAIFSPFKRRVFNDISVIVGIGGLPWFHQRFILLSVGILFVFLFYTRSRRTTKKKVFMVGLFLLLISILYFVFFYSITGNFSPLSPAKLHGKVYVRWETLPLGLFGNIFHPRYGNIWRYPWIILFLFGIYWGFKGDKKLTISLFFIFIPYYLICSLAVPWTGWTSPPGRLLIVLYPIFLIFCGISIKDFFQHFSYQKLLFYMVFFGLVFLNKKFWLLYFSFHPNFLTLQSLIWAIESTGIICFMYLSVFFAEKYFFKQKKNRLVS